LSKLTLIIDKKCKCISHCRESGVFYNFEINCTYLTPKEKSKTCPHWHIFELKSTCSEMRVNTLTTAKCLVLKPTLCLIFKTNKLLPISKEQTDSNVFVKSANQLVVLSLGRHILCRNDYVQSRNKNFWQGFSVTSTKSL
jgi:hypothetical protein